MNNKQSLNRQDETILLAMGGDTFFFIALWFPQARELLESSAVHFDIVKYLRIHFYRLFCKPFKQLSC